MKSETARREIESLDYYLQNHTNDYSEESHTAMMMAIKALEQEPCEDAISRQAVDEAIYDYSRSCDVNYAQIMEYIDKIPSVKPQEPKTGHWIEKDGFDGDVYYDCSECGESWTTIEGTPWDNVWNYCPSCGARMVEPQESEDKE